MSRAGRVERATPAHNGAVLCARWAPDGTSLVSTGEDGAVKVWSRGGMLRTLLAQLASPVYSAAWSGDGTAIAHTDGVHLALKPLAPAAKPEAWKAHDGLVLQVDWSAATGLLASCGEDGRYKVWDAFGRALYTAHALPHPLTSLAWSPDGALLAIGGYRLVQLCDAAGWVHDCQTPDCGSVYAVAWSADGQRVVGAAASGQIILAALAGKTIESGPVVVTQTSPTVLEVANVLDNTAETLRGTGCRDLEGVLQLPLASAHGVVWVHRFSRPYCHVYHGIRLSCRRQRDAGVHYSSSFWGFVWYGLT